MKQETIEQLLLVAGKQEYTQTMTLHLSQVKAMLESAYEAGQRNPHYSINVDNYRCDSGYVADPLGYPTSADLCKTHGI